MGYPLPNPRPLITKTMLQVDDVREASWNKPYLTANCYSARGAYPLLVLVGIIAV
jgi:hypothetical protein